MPNEQLLTHIRTEFARGVDRSVIIRSLITAGWKVEDINAAVAAADSATSTPSIPQVPRPQDVTISAAQSVKYAGFFKRISWVVIGIYYALFVAKIVLPRLVQVDVSWALGFYISGIILSASPIAVLALILVCFSLYLSYKREMIKPRVIVVVLIVVSSILPIKFTLQSIQWFNQSRQIQNQISAIYTDEIPASTSAQLYTPNDITKGLIEKDFEPHFTEAKKDGSYYISIYKKKGEKVDNFGRGVRSYLKDPQNRGLIMYPRTHIQFYGSTVGNDDQKQGSKNCISIGSLMDIMDIGFVTTDAENGINKIYEEDFGDTKLAVYQFRTSPYFKVNLKKGDSCSVVDFANMPADYTFEKIIEISKSMIPKVQGQFESQASPVVPVAIPSVQKVVPTATTRNTTPVVPIVDEVVIHGKAAKGIILNAKIRATEIIGGKITSNTKMVEIGPSGDFSVSMPRGVILLQVVARNGTTEKDEIIGVDTPLPLDFRFRAAVDLVDSQEKSVMINITTYSESAVVLAEKNGGLLAKNINMANSGIANILGLDFLSTEIVQSNDNVRLMSATQTEKKLTILNGTIASMASTDELGCGVRQTYGETINCTIAKFADQFTLTSVPQAVHLGDIGYNAMIRHMALFKAGL